MAERPLLILPTPEMIEPPRRQGRGSRMKTPGRDVQAERFHPVFERLRRALEGDGVGELRADPTSLAPERVIVFEIAGTVGDFARAIATVPGLEFMLEYDTERPPDELFALEDSRRGREGQYRDDKAVPGRFYLAMPDIEAFSQLLSLWDRWKNGGQLDRGFSPFVKVFGQLRDFRPWGAKDRILDETIQYWRAELEREPNRSVRTEVELWFHQDVRKQEEASRRFAAHVEEANGEIVDQKIIEEIAWHGALIDIPAQAISALVERQEVRLALADEVMFMRPQSILRNDLELGDEQDACAAPKGVIGEEEPIAALFDGVPLQRHVLLSDRLRYDDPDELEQNAVVSGRIHGTAMASLILHGDLNVGGAPLDRPLYLRPIMFAPTDRDQESTEADRLLIDTIYRAVLRMKGSEGEEGVAPSVFLVNLSIGDARRPFTRTMSPFARLLDFLANKYSILFLVSAGNVSDALDLESFNTWREFEEADAGRRERAVLAALNGAKHKRTLLSPAESLNAITVGAQHYDYVVGRGRVTHAVDPYDGNELPNPSSAIGLGYRRAIKPEICLPGGREHVRMISTGGGLQVGFRKAQRLFGLKAAAPDGAGRGRLALSALSDGTSSATAVGTRAAHRIFDALMDREGGSLFASMPAEYYAVVVKALLVHRARWRGKSDLLTEICGPTDRRRFAERRDNVSRFLGFGIPNVDETIECTSNRATLVGYGALEPNQAHSYRIPLPSCLERVTDHRVLTVTLAWFSPVKSGHQSYRRAGLEASPDRPETALGVERSNEQQPTDASVKKGTLLHQRYSGRQAVPFIDNGHLSMKIWCKENAGDIVQPIRYGVAVTIESEAQVAIYEEIREKLPAARLRP